MSGFSSRVLISCDKLQLYTIATVTTYYRYTCISTNLITPYVTNLPVCNTKHLKLDEVINSLCSHFAFPPDAVAFTYAHFGTGTGPIYLNNVDCSGSEDSLIECS